MKLTWIGHSCFKVEKDGFVTMIDPCEDGNVPGFLPVQKATVTELPLQTDIEWREEL